MGARRVLDAAISRARRPLVLWCAACGVAGAFLRYRDIGVQMLVDDEWHAIARAASTSLSELVAHYFPRATSIPNNVYDRLLLEAWGWSELGLRFPSVAAGLITLTLLPCFVWSWFRSASVAGTAAFLFACSQFWILYGQSSRPYAPFFLCLVAAYHFNLRALKTGKLRTWALFGASAGAGVSFHLYALPALAPLALVALVRALVRVKHERSGVRGLVRELRGAVLGFGTFSALGLACFALPLLNWKRGSLPMVDTPPRFDGDFFRHAAELITGCRNPAIAVALLAAASLGLVRLARREPLMVSLLGTGFLSTLLFTLVTHPSDDDIALIFLRYNVTAFLLWYVGLGGAVEAVAPRLPRLRGSLLGGVSAVVAAAVYVACSPLPTSNGFSQNNFRLHSAYQEYYDESVSTTPYVTDGQHPAARGLARQVPGFYAELARKAPSCRVLEYPLEIGDDQDPFYFYQRIHGCEVFGGYSKSNAIGSALEARTHRKALHFRQLVDVEDLAAVRGRHIDFLIIHVDPAAELERLVPDGVRYRPAASEAAEAARVVRELRRRLGAPVYSDESLRVFRLVRDDS